MKESGIAAGLRTKGVRILFTVLFMGIGLMNSVQCVKAQYQKVEESNLPLSTMKVYKEKDYSFLETFPYGTTYKGEHVVELETAQQMVNAEDLRLKEGRIVRTSGYYEEGDGGAATYELSSKQNAGGILLENGLYANLIMDTTTIDGKTWGVINPKQLGAKADGQNAEQNMINCAAQLASDLVKNQEDVFRSIVYLPAGEYKCTDQVQINVSDINVVGAGNRTVIFTDNDYSKYYEFFFTMWGAKNLYMADFLVEAREVNDFKYMRQMVFVDCDNVYTYQVDLNIPQEAFSKDYYVDKQYTSLTYYSGNKNMTLDSCKLELLCSTFRGANLGVLDFYSRGESNITIMNCELHSDARDEQVGIFSSRLNKDASFIRNVYFVNNTMYSYQPLDKEAAGGHRNMCFTVAYDDSKNISDIFIKGNHFIADLDSKLMTFGNGIESCTVENNMMDIRCTDNLGAYLFDSSVSEPDRVLIQKNEIYLTYRDTKGTGKAAILGGKATVRENRIVSDTYLGNMGYLSGIYDGNCYINFGCLGSLAKNLEQVTNNKVISYGKFDEMMYFQGTDSDQKVTFSGNEVIDYRRAYEKNNIWNHIAKVQGGLKELSFVNNTYLAPNKYYWTWKDVEHPKEKDYVKGLFFHGAKVDQVVYDRNVLQGATAYASYGCTVTEEDDAGSDVHIAVTNSSTKEYTLDPEAGVCTSVRITKDGEPSTEIFTDQAQIRLDTIVKAGHLDEEGNCNDEAVTTDKQLSWYSALEGIANVEDGLVKRNQYGETTIFAVPDDGAQDADGYALMGKCKVHFVKGFATGIRFEKDQIVLQTTKKYKVVYDVLPAGIASRSVAWSSADESVATVSSLGVVEAVGEGETDIICKTLDGTNIAKTLHVKVEPLTVKRITLNHSEWYDYQYELDHNWANKGVEPGDTIQLQVSAYTPENAVNKGIKKWISTNEAVATVDENGLVTAVGGGTCQIKAYSMDETCYAACGVWVQPDEIPAEEISATYTESRINLKWTPQENITGYLVYCDMGDGKGYQQMSKITSKKEAHYEAYSKKIGGYVEAGKTYQYKVAAYIERWDGNGFSHIYATDSDTVTVTTYANPVISNFNTNGVETIGVTVGGTARLGVYCARNTLKSSYRSGDESIFTVRDMAPDGDDNYDLEITGKKEGLAELILKGEDELGYEKRIPVYVYSFEEIGDAVTAQGTVKGISLSWKVTDKDRQDGFRIQYTTNRQKKNCLITMDQLQLTTNESGEQIAKYTLKGLVNDADYTITVAPYKMVKQETFFGPDSKQVATKTSVYVPVEQIKTESVFVVRPDEQRTINATIGPDDASEPELSWIPLHASIVKVLEHGKKDAVTGYAVIKGQKTGISKLYVVAEDDGNYQTELKIVVTPDSVTDVTATRKEQNITLSWKAVPGATSYVVYRYDPVKKDFEKHSVVSETTYTDQELQPGDTGQYKIAAAISDTDGIYEGTCTDAVKVSPLREDDTTTTENNRENEIKQQEKAFTEQSVEALLLKKYTTKQITLSWNAVTDADGYELSQYKAGQWIKIATIKGGSACSKTVQKLKPGTKYSFRIRAYQKRGEGYEYTKDTAIKTSTKPAKGKIAGVTTGRKRIILRWKKQKADGYEIQCSTSKKFKKNVVRKTAKKSRKKITIKKLKSNRTYYVRIRAYTKVDGKKYYGAWSKAKKTGKIR